MRKSLLFAFFVTSAFLGGCGSHGGPQTVAVTSAQSVDGVLRVRWFPVDAASGYQLRVADSGGVSVFDAEIAPTNCSHSKVEGFTAGVCEYEVETNGDASFNVELRAYSVLASKKEVSPTSSKAYTKAGE